MRFVRLIILSLLLFSGCTTKSSPSPHYATLTPYTKTLQKELPYKLQKHNAITTSLYEQYKKWYNTPYKYGGTTCEGVDCSALVQNVYQDAFGLKVPRDTLHQAKTGHFIKKSSLREGDLLLFKTGYSSRHSAVYIEYGNFLHTSTKHGVTISNLNNPYWKEKYWQARRVLHY
ncbi:MAG: NlpC/P60 family protein [Sulfurimonas sp.]